MRREAGKGASTDNRECTILLGEVVIAELERTWADNHAKMKGLEFGSPALEGRWATHVKFTEKEKPIYISEKWVEELGVAA